MLRHTFRNVARNELTCGLPSVSLHCLAYPAVTALRAKANAIAEFTVVAAFLPAFLSNLLERVDSMTSETILMEDEASWRGRRAANSSIDVSTTAVAEGAGSGHSTSTPIVLA